MTNGSLLLCLFSLAAFLGLMLLASAGVYYLFFRQDSLRRRALAQQASREYERARGRAHRRLLLQALEQPRRERDGIKGDIARLTKERALLHEERQQELVQALETDLVTSRLTEINGIGYALASTIREQVFRGKLTDLYSAQRIRGIGAQKQVAIHQWIRHYQEQLPTLLEGNFKDKSRILAKYQLKFDALDDQLRQLEARLDTVEAKLTVPETALERLQSVTRADFMRARTNGAADSAKIALFLRGVFAEWETPPDWFQELIAITEEDRA